MGMSGTLLGHMERPVVTWPPVLSRLLSFGTQSDVITCPLGSLQDSHRPLLGATGLVSQEKHFC